MLLTQNSDLKNGFDSNVNIFNVNMMQKSDKQDQLLVLLWKILGGEYYGHVTLNNLRMLLLAIKGLHVQLDPALAASLNKADNLINLADVFEDSQNAKNIPAAQTQSEKVILSSFEFKQPSIYLGFFNNNGDMVLFPNDVDRAIKLFSEMKHNRMLYE